jgi:hypothetical protein
MEPDRRHCQFRKVAGMAGYRISINTFYVNLGFARD